ncbi:transmembrane protein 225 isoform X2 [Monodelphis domestica]|uniref:transmembrane protein 225 isoform X2 n=1 Tax=Monodelphis domestica TaxID=13616 RepID=UPI0007B40ADB|nr:transmembrane protein 225 isoform X2 [Monodelphis domestica]
MESQSLCISCLALIMMLLGLIQKEWVKLKMTPSGKYISSSPWTSCILLDCTNVTPDLKKSVWNLMATSTLFSIILTFALGLDYTYLLPPIKGRKYIFSFISFLSGTCLLSAIILYYQDLKNNIEKQYVDFKVTWVFHSNYIIIFLYYACGVLCVWNLLTKFFLNLQELSKRSVITKKVDIRDEATKSTSFLSIVQSQNFGKINKSTARTQISQVSWNF